MSQRGLRTAVMLAFLMLGLLRFLFGSGVLR